MSEAVPLDLVHSSPDGEAVPLDLVHSSPDGEAVPLDLVHSSPDGEAVPLDLVHSSPDGEAVPLDLVHSSPDGEAVLVDLVHGCSPCLQDSRVSPRDSRVSLRDSRVSTPDSRVSPQDSRVSPRDSRVSPRDSRVSLRDSRVFLLCGDRDRSRNININALLSSCRSAQVLDTGSVAECLYRFKQTVDRLGLSSVRVLTSPRGRAVLEVYQDQLFTDLYSFDYRVRVPVNQPTCPPAHTDPPEEVSRFLQTLPALRGDIRVLESTLVPDCFGHGFSTRGGGVSSIRTLSSLNLFSSSRRRDPRALVLENRRRLALHAGFHPQTLHLVKVSHGRDVFVVGRVEPQSYDAVVTDRPGVVIAAPGADCIPVLFADPVLKVIGAAHAGWRGTLLGVAMATVDAMVQEFGCRVSDLVVVMGPSVGPCCFTLDRERALHFVLVHPDCVPDPEAARPHVNIRLATRILLQRGGVLPEHIHDDTVTDRPCVTSCTSCHPELFFSHVRDGPDFGTQVGFLWIRETGAPQGGTDGGTRAPQGRTEGHEPPRDGRR